MTRAIEATKGKVSDEVSRRQELLALLKRAATEPEFSTRLAGNPHHALREYHSLTAEERAALANGDIRKIEAWLGKLDKQLAAWLWCQLSQEKW
jgi:hypothetical protein